MKTNYKVGDAVVYKCDNGDTVSAKVTHICKGCLYIGWYPQYAQLHTACVLKSNYAARLTPLGDAKFLVI